MKFVPPKSEMVCSALGMMKGSRDFQRWKIDFSETEIAGSISIKCGFVVLCLPHFKPKCWFSREDELFFQIVWFFTF